MEDMHIHVRDGVEDYNVLKEYIRLCIEHNITKVVLLEHGPRLSDKHKSKLETVEQIAHLKNNIALAREEFPDIEIFSGIELDFSYDKAFCDNNLQLLKEDFDYVIGGIHSMKFHNGREYLNTVIDMMESYPIDIVAHMLLKYDWEECKDLLDKVFDLATRKKIMIEINTSDRSRWSDEILQYMVHQMLERNVLYTIASDAHYYNEVGYMIEETHKKVGKLENAKRKSGI